jgi:uncharacterized tellurite resistance protein B-like protein
LSRRDELDEALRRKVLGLIFGLTVRDGELSDSEIAFMNRMYTAFDIPRDKESWVMPIGDAEEAAAELRAMPEDAQREALLLLIEAAAVDGVIHEAERAYLDVVAAAVGWTTEELEEQIVEKLAAVDTS